MPGTSAYDVYTLLPAFDCGQCGNPTCMSFARKLLLDIQEPQACVFLGEEAGKQIAGMVGDQPSTREPQTPPEDGIVEIHPCTEEGMVTLWAQLKPLCGKNGLSGDFFDQFQLCESVSHGDIFDKNECSPKMGYAYVEMKGKRTHVFKTGKIIMRRADDREDALATLSVISKLLLPARICSCGNLMADCFGGCCDDCFESTCRAFVQDEAAEAAHRADDKTTMNDILKDHWDEAGDGLSTNFRHIEKLVEAMGTMAEGNESDGSSEETINDIASTIKRSCTRTFMDGEAPGDSIIGLMQYGLVRDVLRAGEGLMGLARDGIECPDEVGNIFFDAYSALKERDIDACSAVWTRYDAYISEWRDERQRMETAKIATNGFYISRILGKPIHDLSMFVTDENRR